MGGNCSAKTGAGPTPAALKDANMKIRALSASIIFILLTVVKISYPNAAPRIRELLVPDANPEGGFAANAIAIGKRLTGQEDVVYTWEKEDEPSPTPSSDPEVFENSGMSPEGFAMSDMVSANLMSFGGYGGLPFLPPETETIHTAPPEQPPPPTESPAPAPEKSELELKLEEFLTAQAVFKENPLPDTVSTELVSIDVDHSAPVTAAVTSVFGYRVHPIHNDVRFHYGTDFAVYEGDAIAAFADGTVIASQEFDGYGKTIILDHGNGITSLYAHCSRLDVAYGDTVTKGQTIALVGKTGNVTGPHLHFELKKDGKYLNPEFYI